MNELHLTSSSFLFGAQSIPFVKTFKLLCLLNFSGTGLPGFTVDVVYIVFLEAVLACLIGPFGNVLLCFSTQFEIQNRLNYIRYTVT